MKNATPTKLKNGEWGAKVEGHARAGETIQIRTKAGKQWTATVDRVIWTGDGVSIVATKSKPSTCTVQGRSYTRAKGYCYYPCPVSGLVCSPENGPCHDCM